MITMQARQLSNQDTMIRMQAELLEAQAELIKALQVEMAELRRWLGSDSSNSSTPQSEAGGADRNGDPRTARGRGVGGVRRSRRETVGSETGYGTATKWGIDKLHALRMLFTSEPWLPPALIPS
jgi:hypothetical protein